jgi:hypothetical protein
MAIDAEKILRAVVEGSKIRDEKGIIPIFGVYLNFFYVDFYNYLSFEFAKLLGHDRENEAAILLIQAAQECAYATFQGIRSSREWEEIVHPMIEVEEDQIYGFTAVAWAFGWGDLRVKELIPGERMVLEANGWYEAPGYLQVYGLSDSGKCYGIRGVAGAFMDLLYGGDYPDGCFTFLAAEPLCRAKGDPRCEFVTRKAPEGTFRPGRLFG